MSAIPVECQAVDTSPQGMVMVQRRPRRPPKSISRESQATGTGTLLPPRRIAPAAGAGSTPVLLAGAAAAPPAGGAQFAPVSGPRAAAGADPAPPADRSGRRQAFDHGLHGAAADPAAV